MNDQSKPTLWAVNTEPVEASRPVRARRRARAGALRNDDRSSPCTRRGPTRWNGHRSLIRDDHSSTIDAVGRPSPPRPGGFGAGGWTTPTSRCRRRRIGGSGVDIEALGTTGLAGAHVGGLHNCQPRRPVWQPGGEWRPPIGLGDGVGGVRWPDGSSAGGRSGLSGADADRGGDREAEQVTILLVLAAPVAVFVVVAGPRTAGRPGQDTRCRAAWHVPHGAPGPAGARPSWRRTARCAPCTSRTRCQSTPRGTCELENFCCRHGRSFVAGRLAGT